MHRLERQRKILELLKARNVVTVEQACQYLSSSPATIRRDLNELEKNHLLRRVHGGATRLSPRLASSNFETRLALQVQQKTAIARYAASLCNPGDSIILNGGTTTWHMCEFLRSASLQLLTNSLPIASTLQSCPDIQVFLTGGEVYSDQHIVLGGEQPGAQFYASKMFMSAHAITDNGLMESDTRLIRAEQALVQQAEELIVLADSSKFGNTGSLQLCPLNRINLLVTDEDIHPRIRDRLEQAGVSIHIVTTTSGHPEKRFGVHALD